MRYLQEMPIPDPDRRSELMIFDGFEARFVDMPDPDVMGSSLVVNRRPEG